MYISNSTFREHLPSFETLSYASAFLVAAAVSHLFNSCLMVPFFTIAVSMTISAVALKIYSVYDNLAACNLKEDLLNFQERYPKLQLIAFIFILIVTMASPVVGFAGALFFGAFTGLLLDADQCKRNAAKHKNTETPNPFSQIV